jgi:thiol-disulfide isomerase/thioredoxin
VNLLACGALVSAVIAAPAGVAAQPGGEGSDPKPSWLDRLKAEDRGCIDRCIGYAPPAFTDDLLWFDSEPMTWKGLRGRVVVVQSWTNRTGAGRNWAINASRLMARYDENDVQFIALHTPEGADTAAAFLDRRGLDLPVAVDRNGSFCDELGAYERPVNLLIDRNGIVRYAGLNQRGLKAALALLVAEPHDPNAIPRARPPAEAEPPPEFPPIEGGVRNAADLRGRRAPEMFVSQWLNGRPDATGKVAVIDFWATWCPPCRATIPHLNELAEKFREDAVCIGLSNEKPDRFRGGLRKYRLRMDGFRYHLALDPSGRMQRAVGVRGIPHVIVMSSDWVVRWQGHPATLDEATLARIVEANRGLNGGGEPLCSRWAPR